MNPRRLNSPMTNLSFVKCHNIYHSICVLPTKEWPTKNEEIFHVLCTFWIPIIGLTGLMVYFSNIRTKSKSHKLRVVSHHILHHIGAVGT